ncbi:hypothetical protein D3C75_1070860 [compost metagenome]
MLLVPRICPVQLIEHRHIAGIPRPGGHSPYGRAVGYGCWLLFSGHQSAENGDILGIPRQQQLGLIRMALNGIGPDVHTGSHGFHRRYGLGIPQYGSAVVHKGGQLGHYAVIPMPAVVVLVQTSEQNGFHRGG